MPLWLIPMMYTALSVTAGLVLPRLERAYFPRWLQDISASAAMAFYSAVSSGTMALTGIVFAIAFVAVQFSAVAYSPRLVVMFANSRGLYHTLGLFFATFVYSLVALLWTDRGGSGSVPLLSSAVVGVLLVISLLAFARLIQSIADLQIHNVLQEIGMRGSAVIQAMFREDQHGPAPNLIDTDLGPASQTLLHSGNPRVVAEFDAATLARVAERGNAVVALDCAVGDTLLAGQVLMQVYGGRLPEHALRRAVKLAGLRSFEQDPKYAIRLLVDIAIRALSPAVNDPTTAVQAIDQIEHLLRLLGASELEVGYAQDSRSVLRVTFPVPTWEDYLSLAFDEIRQFGATSVQVARRLHAALAGLAGAVSVPARREAVLQYLNHLEEGVGRSGFDQLDLQVALQEDRQGLGLPRRRAAVKHGPAMTGPGSPSTRQ